MTIVLGIHGYARVGKDTLADAFVQNYGFTKIAFADPIREVLMALDPIIAIPRDGEPRYLAEEVTQRGWEEAKGMYPDIRQWMGKLGQSMRKEVSERVWVNKAFNKAEGLQRVVYSDVRQLNEAALLKEYFGANLIHLVRPGIGPANEVDLSLPPDLFRWKVNNQGDVTDLRAQADMLMSRIQLEREAKP